MSDNVFIFKAEQIQINLQAFNGARFREYQKRYPKRYVRIEFEKPDRKSTRLNSSH